MRVVLMLVILVAGLASYDAAVAGPSTWVQPAGDRRIVRRVYYRHGRYYRYRYHGHYYRYRYHGHYYNHRYYRHGHWHYY